eukprot:1877838-Rhodomonas_salina.2
MRAVCAALPGADVSRVVLSVRTNSIEAAQPAAQDEEEEQKKGEETGWQQLEEEELEEEEEEEESPQVLKLLVVAVVQCMGLPERAGALSSACASGVRVRPVCVRCASGVRPVCDALILSMLCMHFMLVLPPFMLIVLLTCAFALCDAIC